MTRNMRTAVLAFILLLAGAVDSYAQNAVQTAPAKVPLQPGDVIRLWVWRQEDMSGDFHVPENGMIVLPKLGPRHVTGIQPAMLRDTLIAEYSRYLRHPSIEVRFLRKIRVLGAVKTPGVFFVDETSTVAEAIAQAGGPTESGKFNEVELYRGGEKLVQQIATTTRIADLPLSSGDQLYVPQRGWLARNSGIVAALASSLVGLAGIVVVTLAK